MTLAIKHSGFPNNILSNRHIHMMTWIAAKLYNWSETALKNNLLHHHDLTIFIPDVVISTLPLVCYKAVLCVVTQHSFPEERWVTARIRGLEVMWEVVVWSATWPFFNSTFSDVNTGSFSVPVKHIVIQDNINSILWYWIQNKINALSVSFSVNTF